MPLLLQPVRACSNPEGCRHVFHTHILLYIYPVICDVYILYRSGEPRPKGETKAQPVRGWLCFGDAGRSYPHEEAHLYRSQRDSTEIVPFLDYARVKKIKRGGLRIEGQQEHGYREYWPQVWWCLPVVTEMQPFGQYEPVPTPFDETIRAAVSQVDATGVACALDGDHFTRWPLGSFGK
ncbi:hypothetical protein [Variovorax paradoxus]|uniref:hypothetical protein n=1 Tax=Variovorax paradoxus TaxID=34073 RepID=UPI003ECCB665